MAGMAEMAQMAAILKYKRYTQECQCNGNVLSANTMDKTDRRFAKSGKETYTKNLQGRWRDMKENFGGKTDKGVNKKLL